MKYTFATTSVAALLLAMPALAQAQAATSSNPASPANNAPAATAQAPAANAADPATPAHNASDTTAQASGGAANGTGPEIIVKQPPPVITVQPHAPSVTVTPGKPDVAVQQAPPKVDVATPKPNVVVDTGKPQVNVLPGAKPDVAVQPPAGNTNGTTAPAGTAANQSNDNTTAGSGSTTPPGSGTAAVAPTTGVFPMATDAKNLIDKNVYGADGNQVGEVNNLLVGTDGRVHAAVIEFGGFLGIGERKVAVPWDQLTINNDRVTTNMTADQIKTAPQWDKNKPGQFAEYQPLNK